VIEIVQYEGSEPTIRENRIVDRSVARWMKKRPRRTNTGQEVAAYAKILVIGDSQELDDGWDLFEEPFREVIEACRIDISLLSYAQVCSHGAYTVDNHSLNSDFAPVCFCSVFSFDNTRAVWSFDPKEHCTRVIVIKDALVWDFDLVDHLRANLASLASPLFLSATSRRFLLFYNRLLKNSADSALTSIEKGIGYYGFANPDSAAETVDLAEASKSAGAEISRLGFFLFRLSLYKSLRKQLSQGDEYRWAQLFPNDEHDKYREICKAVLRLDDLVEQDLETMEAEMLFQQDRAKTLLNVVSDAFSIKDGSCNIIDINLQLCPALQSHRPTRCQCKHRTRQRLSHHCSCRQKR
jgi:hypothetical protein